MSWTGLRRFFSWYFRSWFDWPERRPYPTDENEGES